MKYLPTSLWKQVISAYFFSTGAIMFPSHAQTHPLQGLAVNRLHNMFFFGFFFRWMERWWTDSKETGSRGRGRWKVWKWRMWFNSYWQPDQQIPQPFLRFMVLQHLIAGCVFTSSWRGLLVNEFTLNSVEDDEDNEPHKGANPGSI